MPARHLTLLVPGLWSHTDCSELPERLPALETLVSRADRHDDSPCGWEARLLSLFSVPSAAEDELPVAALSYLADTNQPPPGPCLRADPVHLLPDRDELVLLDAASLALREAEAQRLIAELNAVYGEDGWCFEAPTPERWYLHLPTRPRLRTWPLSAVAGQPIGQRLPGGEQGKVWHRVMNEVQMLLHSSDINRQRESEGRLTVSSLWFWGGGELPASMPASHWSKVWGDDPLAIGLARHFGVAQAGTPADAAAWLADVGMGDKYREDLLLLDGLASALQQSGEAWWAALQGFEQAWVEPLLAALREKRIDSVFLDDAEGRRYVLTRRGLRRWWRRRLPLSWPPA